MTFHDTSRPVLAAKAELRLDPITAEPILLYPEGMLHLNSSAHAILSLCDGTRSLGEILTALAERYEAPVADLQEDVTQCLEAFSQRQLIQVSP